MAEKIELGMQDDFVTLGQFLKMIGLIGTGGQAKWFLEENTVKINHEHEVRRGKKLFVGDEISIEGHGSYLITKPS